MKATVKIYSVTFKNYTNGMRDTVSKNSDEYSGLGEYITVGHDNFLIREDEIDKYRHWGGGIKELIFVGNMLDTNDSTDD